MNGAALATFVVGGYALGSISFADWLAKRRGVDLRQVGSGNLGATNAGRALGKGTGRLVLVLDALKGALPVLGAKLLGMPDEVACAAGAAAVVGHCFPAWHGLRGGKGAATGLGAMLAAAPVAGLVAAGTYLALSRVTGRASVGSLAGALAATGVQAFMGGLHVPATWLSVGVAALVVLKHRGNIVRLLNGTEPRGDAV